MYPTAPPPPYSPKYHQVVSLSEQMTLAGGVDKQDRLDWLPSDSPSKNKD